MSSLPLLSHHLFVAAVNDRNDAARAAAEPEAPACEADRPVKQVSIEFVDPGVVLPLQVIATTDAFGCAGSP
jgi:hypothetical protein